MQQQNLSYWAYLLWTYFYWSHKSICIWTQIDNYVTRIYIYNTHRIQYTHSSPTHAPLLSVIIRTSITNTGAHCAFITDIILCTKQAHITNLHTHTHTYHTRISHVMKTDTNTHAHHIHTRHTSITPKYLKHYWPLYLREICFFLLEETLHHCLRYCNEGEVGVGVGWCETLERPAL